jgi:hypothetical protein
MSLADEVVARIDRDKLVQVALEICNIDSAAPFEAEVAEHLYQWLSIAHEVQPPIAQAKISYRSAN